MVEVKKLSATRGDTFLQCRLKYRFVYHSDIRTTKSDPLKLGIAVHETIEELDKILTRDKIVTKELYDVGLDLFNKHAVDVGLHDLSLFKVGKDMVMDRLDKYEPEHIVSIDGKPAIEYRFNVTLDNGVPLIGAFDKVLEIGDGMVEIVDYKTSKIAMSQSEAQSNIQVGVYNAVARKLFPKKHIRLNWHYLRPGMKQLKITVSDEDTKFFESFLKSLYNKILNTSEKEMFPTPNQFCGWCDFRGMCKAYQSMLSDVEDFGKPLTEMSNSEFVKEWEKIKNQKKAVDVRERELKMAAHETIKREGKEIVGDDYEIYPQQTSRLRYDPKTVFDVVPQEDFLGMVNVVKRSVDDYIEKNPKIRNRLLETASISYDAPSYRTRKTKKEK
jgi:putative RecB family exonuclease